VLVNDGLQSPEELNAHYGPEGPVVVAQTFFEALKEEGSLRAAYEVMTPGLRRDRTDAWVAMNAQHPTLVNADRAHLAEKLAEPEPDHPLWPAYESSSVDDFRRAYSFADLGSYGYASRPRPVGVNQEIVLLIKGNPDRPKVIERPMLASGAQFVMEYRDDVWLVAGFSRVYSAAELIEQGQSRESIVSQLVSTYGIEQAEAEEIFDESLADDE
jgi:hypothetical protein